MTTCVRVVYLGEIRRLLVTSAKKIKELKDRRSRKSSIFKPFNNRGSVELLDAKGMSVLDKLRYKQRYLTLIYAFLRGVPYRIVEMKKHNMPYWGYLRDLYEQLTRSKMSEEDRNDLVNWLYGTDARRDKPTQVSNPMPQEVS